MKSETKRKHQNKEIHKDNTNQQSRPAKNGTVRKNWKSLDKYHVQPAHYKQKKIVKFLVQTKNEKVLGSFIVLALNRSYRAC